ncbi:hypothetical protein V8D89_006153 [Ganoderma adspersum]
MGTWYFRSAVLGRYPCKPYELSDDIESFIHVFHYSVLRFHKTNKTEDLEDYFRIIYERAIIRPEDGAHLGGTSKFQNMCMSTSFIKPDENEGLELVLNLLAGIYSQHYATIDEKEYKRKYNPGSDPAKAAAPPASQEPRQLCQAHGCVQLRRTGSLDSGTPDFRRARKAVEGFLGGWQVGPRYAEERGGPVQDRGTSA